MKRRNNKIRLITLAVLAIGLIGWAVYAKYGKPKTASTVTPTQQALQDEVSKNAEVANKDFVGTTDNGGIADTAGKTQPVTSQSSPPISSASGIITLSSPGEGSKLATGITISGTAKVPEVQYRITDDSYGMLAMGPLSVTNGKYSGTVTIKSHGSTGALEIFNFNSAGVEENHVKVKVTF